MTRLLPREPPRGARRLRDEAPRRARPRTVTSAAQGFSLHCASRAASLRTGPIFPSSPTAARMWSRTARSRLNGTCFFRRSRIRPHAGPIIRQHTLERTEDARATLRSAEAARGKTEVALRRLSTLLSLADVAGARPFDALRLIAEIELGRGRFAEAAEAAQDGLEAVYPATVPPADTSAAAGILREARRRDARALADARGPGDAS